jgi:hypothetical protein
MTEHRINPLRALAAALAIAGACFAIAAPRASATPVAIGPWTCEWNRAVSTACLKFDYAGYGWYAVNWYLDVELPAQYAREVADCDPSVWPWKSELWGDDGGPGKDDLITRSVARPGFPVAGPDYVHAEYTNPFVNSDKLDEDDDRNDELYGVVSFVDCHTGLTRRFRTAQIVMHF